jgi:hypothetical protein
MLNKQTLETLRTLREDDSDPIRAALSRYAIAGEESRALFQLQRAAEMRGEIFDHIGHVEKADKIGREMIEAATELNDLATD